jgi:2-dehydro-3-deoxyglucarate aldolase/4-hydroxy-2-oxoheptanedioate aldolase
MIETHDFAARLRAGRTLLGTIVTLDSSEVVEILSGAGFDWLFIDTEHAPLDALAAQRLLQAARIPCVIRVPDGAEATLKKALDAGAAGVVVPMVNSAAQAEAVVEACKYPPRGRRGVGIARAQGYGPGFGEYVRRANDATAVIVQCEHIRAVENIESIVAVAGVDAIFVGPYDLSGSMGRLGDVEHLDVLAAIEGVRLACERAGKPLGIFTGAPEAARRFVAQGYSLVAVGADTMLLGGAARQAVAALR